MKALYIKYQFFKLVKLSIDKMKAHLLRIKKGRRFNLTPSSHLPVLLEKALALAS